MTNITQRFMDKAIDYGASCRVSGIGEDVRQSFEQLRYEAAAIDKAFQALEIELELIRDAHLCAEHELAKFRVQETGEYLDKETIYE